MSSSRPFANKRVVIVHGYMASPTDHWFPALKRSLEVEGAQVDVVALPESNEPQVDAWARTLKEALPVVDDRTFIIGHSLGCVTALRHLQSLPNGTRAAGIVLVSGFDCPLDTIPALAAFTSLPLDHDVVRKRAAHIVSIVSDNDVIVDTMHSHALAESLGSDLQVVNGGGHFMAEDGFTALPQVHEALRRMV